MTAPLREPPALHDKAIQDLSFIRRTMEGASSFTDVPGYGLVAIGATALVTAGLAEGQQARAAWLTTWLAEAAVAVGIASAMMWRKMRRRTNGAGFPRLSVPARKFLLGLLPALTAGAVLTWALYAPALLPFGKQSPAPHLAGMWMLLYGVGIATAGMFSVRAVPLMGLAFMGLGTLALAAPSLNANLMLALGFGVVQMGFGWWIARRHGG